MADKQPSVVERVLMNFMGPADVGDPDAPSHPVFNEDDICSHCGQPRSEHPITRDPELGSITHCPE